MSSYTAISDTSEYLLRLLRGTCVPDPIPDGELVGLVTEDTLGSLSLGLHLYDISQMNLNLKTGCIHLCLKYKLTAHSSAIPEQRAQEEQRILGRAILALADNPLIRAGTEFLSADDADVSIAFENTDADDYRRFSHQDRRCELFVLYSVSPILLDTTAKPAAVRVRSTR